MSDTPSHAGRILSNALNMGLTRLESTSIEGYNSAVRTKAGILLLLLLVGCKQGGLIPPADTQAPSAPANLSAAAQSQSQISLSWSASSDNVGVTGYLLERCQGASCTNFSQAATPITSSYSDTGLSAATTYRYRVRATDAAGNRSGYSGIANQTTQVANPGSSRVFYDGFESGNANLWQQDDLHARCEVVGVASVDGRTPRAGSSQAQCNWDGTQVSDVWQGLTQQFAIKNETFIRYWVRYATDVDVSPNGGLGGKQGRLTTQSYGDGNQLYWGADSDGDVAWVTVIENGAPWGAQYGSIGVNDHQWHKIEIYVKPGLNGEGVVKVWHDGVLQFTNTYSNITAAGQKYNTFYLMSNWSGGTGCCTHDASNHLYWDEFEVFTDGPGGTPATGSMAEGSVRVTAAPNPTH